ncbi:MAG: exonuclease SbcCD subunit D [Chloroflexota bacterium]
MKPLRIAHLADTHLGHRQYPKPDPVTGRNQRAVDVELAFERAIDDILAREPDLVIHAGDVFDHVRPSWTTLRVFVRAMRKIELAGIPCLVIAGNHDTPRLRTSGSVYSLLEMVLPGIRFAAGYDMPAPWRPEGLDVALHPAPHGALTNPDPPLPLLLPGLRNVLVFHGLAPQAQSAVGHEPGEESLTPEMLDSEADYIALGHYHIPGEQTRNAWYAGSTERFGFRDERVDPGYNLVTLGDPGAAPRVERISLPGRPMHTLKPVDGEGLEARQIANLILDRAARLDDPDAITRVEVRGAPRPVRREAERLVRAELADRVWLLDIRAPVTYAGLDPVAGERVEHLPPLPDLFAQFIADRTERGDYDPAFADAFRERGGRALAEAIRTAEERLAIEEAAG